MDDGNLNTKRLVREVLYALAAMKHGALAHRFPFGFHLGRGLFVVEPGAHYV